jgi:hypothetical protein
LVDPQFFLDFLDDDQSDAAFFASVVAFIPEAANNTTGLQLPFTCQLVGSRRFNFQQVWSWSKIEAF